MNINSSTTTPEIRAYIKAQAVKTAVSLAKQKKVTEAEVMFESSVLDWISSTAEVGDRDIDALNMVIEKRFAAENYNFCSIGFGFESFERIPSRRPRQRMFEVFEKKSWLSN